MRNDQIFVLLLVVLLPMSGCMDNAVGDAEGTDEDNTTINNYYNQTNQLPVIYNHMFRGTYEFYLNVMAQDYDGNITDFGADLNLNGLIDVHISSSPYDRVTMDYTENWSNPILYNPNNAPENDGVYDLNCQQWLQLIAIDDDGGMSYHPLLIISDYRDENDDGLHECTGRIIGTIG
ncbi:hypothetical protein N9X79_00255 [Euryarchaeota archaeon]|nr:hypothetical protein [Euryarchaeota archaeon]